MPFDICTRTGIATFVRIITRRSRVTWNRKIVSFFITKKLAILSWQVFVGAVANQWV